MSRQPRRCRAALVKNTLRLAHRFGGKLLDALDSWAQEGKLPQKMSIAFIWGLTAIGGSLQRRNVVDRQKCVIVLCGRRPGLS
jgi:hypothetical protein